MMMAAITFAQNNSFLKPVAAIVLLLAFAAQTFHKAYIVFDYMTNQTVYAAQCENKAKPQLKCKGKCQMMKKLQEEEKRESKNPEKKIENKQATEFSSKSFYPFIHISFTTGIIHFAKAPAAKLTDATQTLLRPPTM